MDLIVLTYLPLATTVCRASDSWPNFATMWLGCNRTPNSQSSAKSRTHQARILSNVIIVLFLSNKTIFILQMPKLHLVGVSRKGGMWDDTVIRRRGIVGPCSPCLALPGPLFRRLPASDSDTSCFSLQCFSQSLVPYYTSPDPYTLYDD
jgi:hypothetical protein